MRAGFHLSAECLAGADAEAERVPRAPTRSTSMAAAKDASKRPTQAYRTPRSPQRTAVCLTGLWRAGSDLDRCRSHYLSSCVSNPTVFRIHSIQSSDGSRVFQQQWRQLLLCKQRIREHEESEGVRFARVLRTRPDVITYPLSLGSRPVREDVAYTYACFWTRSACLKVQLNDVWMAFGRTAFERLVTHDFAPVTSRERGKLCNFTGAVKDRLSFECWLHVQSARRKVALSWRPIGKHPGWILHRGSTPQKRVSLSRLNCSCTRARARDVRA